MWESKQKCCQYEKWCEEGISYKFKKWLIGIDEMLVYSMQGKTYFLKRISEGLTFMVDVRKLETLL